MVRSIITTFAAATLLTGTALAENLKTETGGVRSVYACSFTEPFVQVFVNSSTPISKLSGTPAANVGDAAILVPTGEKEINGSVIAVSDQNGISNLQLGFTNGRMLQLKINRNQSGSDGMREDAYDFEGQLQLEFDSTPLIGGCNQTL